MGKDILFLTPYNIFPPFWGGGTRTYNLIKHLSKENNVHVIMPSYRQFKDKKGLKHRRKLKEMDVEYELVGPGTSWIQYTNPLLFTKALKKTREEDIDLIICDYPWSGFYALALHKLTQTPFFLMEHNVEFEVAEQTGYEDPRLTKNLEGKLCDKASKVFCVCGSDKDKLCNEFGIPSGKVSVLDNGFDSDRFNMEDGDGKKIRKELGVGNDPLIFFCGKMDYVPNSEAVGLIYHEVMPRVLEEVPDAKFLIVGGGYNLGFSHESMIFTGVVDHLVDYLRASDLVITPLRRGGGTRIKVLEAIGCGKDIVSTPKGVEGLINEYTESFINVEKNWDDFADAVIEKITNGKDPKPRDEFFEKYAWENIYKKIDPYIEAI